MNSYATEIIDLSDVISYKPIYISTDKRIVDIEKTTMKYLQVGGPTVADKIGNALGAIFKVEFVSVLGIATDYIKIWGIHNNDASAVIYPKTYLEGKTLDVILNKFEFTDAAGTPSPSLPATYTIMGHRKNTQPIM